MNWAFQLYSARHTAIAETLQIVSDAGYKSVEAFRENFSDTSAFKAALQQHELEVPSMHINLQPLRDETEQMMQRARDFSTHHIVCPYLEDEQRPLDTAGWRILIAELSDHAKRWRDAGFTFAWHNHDFEFQALEDGTVPMQLIMENAPELQWEIDVAWIVRAGTDPVPWIKQHASQISAVHLKDLAAPGECSDEDGWADLGHGVVPWTSVMPLLAQTPANLYVMEHDNPSDLQRFANRSMATATAFDDQPTS